MPAVVTELPPGYSPDVIIVGGGATGNVVAGRLAAATPTLEVLLLESGSNNQSDQLVIRPSNLWHHHIPGAKTAKAYTSSPLKNLNNRAPSLVVGNVLGGGSSINFMQYTRGSKSDYDSWEQPGWSFEELLPYFKRFESYHCETPEPDLHGYDGPIHISYGGYHDKKFHDASVEAGKVLGYEFGLDCNNFKTANGFMRVPKFIHPKTGHRGDSAHGYIHSFQGDNLKVLCDAPVMKVIIENGRATGVTFRQAGAPPASVYAKKLVVVSAGALGTPQVLERSGVGNPDLLEPLGIEVKSALKGVGENLGDHYIVMPCYKTDGSFNGSGAFLMGGGTSVDEDEFVKNGSGKFTTNFTEITAKLAPRTEDDWKFVGKKNKEYYTKYSDKPSAQMSVAEFSLPNQLSTTPSEEGFNPVNAITSGFWTTYPFDKGSIHITVADDSAPPDYDPNFYDSEDDLKMSIWAYETVDKISMKIPGVIGRVSNTHPQPGQSTEDYLKQFVGSTWHVLGSARIGKPEEGGVVNEKLEVHGVEGLMVADLSVCVGNIGSNTYTSALMIGEKAADLVATKLGLALNIIGGDNV